MNILIIGSGGRESALAWKISQSRHCDRLFITPGNGGTAAYGSNVVLDISTRELEDFLLKNQIELLLIGPEDPLVNGIYDRLKDDPALAKLQIIGPSKEGAMLEGSKSFAKAFMQEFNIPTAAYQSFGHQQIKEALVYLESIKPPYVLKADGLAAGKGVLILNDKEEAKIELELMLSGKFGEAGKTVVIEEFLEGIEFSVFAITDGESYKLLPIAKDYKRRGEGDSGLNTGGMGAVSPVPFVDAQLMQKVEDRVIKPTIAGIKEKNIDYKGFVFFGLINVGGNPFVIEYNCRLGDPETEVIIPRLKTDLVELMTAVYSGKLHEQPVDIDPKTAATIMLVSNGYPGSYDKGKEITGMDAVKESIVFHAGSIVKNDKYFTNGGRVLAITSMAENMEQALALSKTSIDLIHFEGKRFRADIGFDLM